MERLELQRIINEHAIRFLTDLGHGHRPPLLEDDGLCKNLECLMEDFLDSLNNDWPIFNCIVESKFYDVVSDAAPCWKHFSGDIHYPVCNGEDDYYNDDGILLWEGRFLEPRKSLCLHVAEYLKQKPVQITEGMYAELQIED